MSDKLTDRLRGKYKIGPEGLHGTRDFSGFTPKICDEAAERIEVLESFLRAVVSDGGASKNLKSCARDLLKPQ